MQAKPDSSYHSIKKLDFEREKLEERERDLERREKALEERESRKLSDKPPSEIPEENDEPMEELQPAPSQRI